MTATDRNQDAHLRCALPPQSDETPLSGMVTLPGVSERLDSPHPDVTSGSPYCGPVNVYPGYPLDNAGRWVGITLDGQFVTGGPNEDITTVGGWGDHPLAHVRGIEMLITLLNVDDEWSRLTKAQQRCMQDPATRTARPWESLRGKGLVNDNGLTPHGVFLVTAARKTRAKVAQ